MSRFRFYGAARPGYAPAADSLQKLTLSTFGGNPITSSAAIATIGDVRGTGLMQGGEWVVDEAVAKLDESFGAIGA